MSLSPGGGGTSGPVGPGPRGLAGRNVIVDIRTTGVALAVGIALLASAFGLVAQVEDAAFSWWTAVILASSVALFLGGAFLGVWLFRAAFETWRRAVLPRTGACGGEPRRWASPARDGHADRGRDE